MLYYIFFINFCSTFPLDGSYITTESPRNRRQAEKSEPEALVVPDLIELVMAPPELDMHVLEQHINELARNEQTDSDGNILKNPPLPDFALNLKDASGIRIPLHEGHFASLWF